MIALFLLFVATTYALTCQNYHHDKCISVGCDVHCQALGKRSGYCGFSGQWCTCYCVAYMKNDVAYVEDYESLVNTSKAMK